MLFTYLAALCALVGSEAYVYGSLISNLQWCYICLFIHVHVVEPWDRVCGRGYAAEPLIGVTHSDGPRRHAYMGY